MNETVSSERGATMVIVAASLIALFGFAALAVDGSGFYQTARVDQTTADLSCLAGVAELPDTSQAIDTAVAYTKANWPEMNSASLSVSGDTGTLSDGQGNTVTYEVNHGGDPDVMYVAVTDRDPTTFGKVVGVTSVDIRQEAACRQDTKLGGPGALPLGALAGTFSGDLFDCSAKVTGNCGALDSGSGANAFRDSIAYGWDQQLEKHHGVETNPDPNTGDAVIYCPSSGPCSADNSETGN